MHSRLKFDIGWASLLWAAAGLPVSRARVTRARMFVESGWGGRRGVIGLSARTLFDALLAELALPAGAKIIMSGVNIQNMFDLARLHGLEIIPVDINPATLAPMPGALLDAQAKSGASICVVAQLYGSVSPLHDASALRERGVFVLEDAAQAFADRSYTGDANADATLFSFGPIKRRTAMGGGVGVFRDRVLAARVEARLASHEMRSESWLRRRAFKYLLLKALTLRPIYGALLQLVRISGNDPEKVIGEAARGFSGPSLAVSIRAQPPGRLVVLMAHQINTAEDASSRQSACLEFLSQLPPEFTKVGEHAERHAYWLLAICCRKPEEALDFLRSHGFDATRGTTSLRAETPGRTPVAARMLESVVYLPHPAGLSAGARRRLISALCDYAGRSELAGIQL